MREVKRGFGGELFQGAVCGLGISLAIWIPLITGTLADGRIVLPCLLAALAGLSRGTAGWPAPAVLPWVLAAWQLEGAAAAMLVAVLAAAGSRFLAGVPRSITRLAFDTGAAALAIAAADGIAARSGGPLHPEILFGAVYVVVLLALHAIRRRLAGRTQVRRIWKNMLLTAGVLAAGIAGSWVVVWLWSQPTLRVWLVVGAALRVGLLIGSRTGRTNGVRRRRRHPATPDRVRERTAVALARTLPEGAPGGHLWRTEALCRALAERLGSDPTEMRRLRQAALLHHIGRVAHDDPTIDVHPRVAELSVRQLGFADEVCTILAHAPEHWNGDGPHGLRGERIARGARILAVADRYDQLTHPPEGARRHTTAMTLLQCEPGERYDPLMLEILDELADTLNATGADLTRDPTSIGADFGGTRLVQAEHDLQTLYAIERAVTLPVGLRERLTLVAGLLRALVPFQSLDIGFDDGETFRYGDREAGPCERTVALIDDGDEVGRLTLTTAQDPDAACNDRLIRAAALLARMIADDGRAGTSLTDPATGLPNAGYLRRALAGLVPERGHAAPGFGLIALHVRDLGRLAERRGQDAADRFLRSVARRLAAACDERETALRLGPDQFIVLTGENRGGELVRRWHALVEQVGREPIALDGGEETVRLDAAHAAHPLDGDRLEVLLRALEARLTGTTAATVLPFRDRAPSAAQQQQHVACRSSRRQWPDE